MTAKKKLADPGTSHSSGRPSNVPKTASGKTDADFNKLARRVSRMEKQMAALLKAAAPAPAPKARKVRPTKQDLAEAQVREAVQAELGYSYMITTNVMADIDRLLRDQMYIGVGAPRAGKDPAYEAVRLATASSLVASFAAENLSHWAEFEPAPGQPYASMPPAQARSWLLGHYRGMVENNLPRKGEQVAEGITEDIFATEPPTKSFDRLNAAPDAADEGAALGQQVIFNIFDQLERDVPGYGKPNAIAAGNEAVVAVQETLSKSVVKYSPARPQSFDTHEQLFADCYVGITLQALENACNLIGFGRIGPPGTDGRPEPRRMAGAVLTDMEISQRANPDMLEADELNEKGIDNGVPAESVKSVHAREMIRVIDVLQDSLYNGELQNAVRSLYHQRAQEIFPGTEARAIDGKFESSGWNDVRKILEKSNLALFHLAQKEDGYTSPKKSPPDRDSWSFASTGLH